MYDMNLKLRGILNWGRDKMAAILDIFKCIFLNENFEFQRKFEVCSLGSNWKYVRIGSDNGLIPRRRLAIILTNDELTYLLIYASLGLDELIQHFMYYQFISEYTYPCHVVKFPQKSFFFKFLLLSVISYNILMTTSRDSKYQTTVD